MAVPERRKRVAGRNSCHSVLPTWTWTDWPYAARAGTAATVGAAADPSIAAEKRTTTRRAAWDMDVSARPFDRKSHVTHRSRDRRFDSAPTLGKAPRMPRARVR